jgi:hypothetical protein
MIIVQISYSIATLISAYSVVFQYMPRVGVLLGFFMQFAWVHYWYTTGQLGIIILDSGILLIYVLRLIKYWRERCLTDKSY